MTGNTDTCRRRWFPKRETHVDLLELGLHLRDLGVLPGGDVRQPSGRPTRHGSFRQSDPSHMVHGDCKSICKMQTRERALPVLGFGLLALLPGPDQRCPLLGGDPGQKRV